MSRLRIGVLFGGRSTEHEVSILSAQSIIAAMDPQRFEAVQTPETVPTPENERPPHY